MSVTREKLYEEVWAEPMMSIAKRYGTFSTVLAKACDRLNVPRPPNGYWAKVRAGHRIPRPPLPPAQVGDETEWVRWSGDRREARPVSSQPSRRRSRPRSNPDVLGSEHPILVGIREHFEKVRVTESGFLRPAKQLMADIFVSSQTLERAVKLANELYMLLEGKGHRVVIAPRDVHYSRRHVDHREGGGRDLMPGETWSPGRPTIAFIRGVAFGLTIFEVSEEVEMKYINGKYVPLSEIPVPKRRPRYEDYSWTAKRERPSGRLSIQAYSPYNLAAWSQRWDEKAPGELESRLPALVRALEQQVPTIKALVEEGAREAERRQKEWEAQQRKWRREEIARREAAALKESREEFLVAVDRWARAMNLEAFFTEARKQASAAGADADSALQSRLERARQLFGGTNPLEHLRSWRTPEERFNPIPGDEDDEVDDHGDHDDDAT